MDSATTTGILAKYLPDLLVLGLMVLAPILIAWLGWEYWLLGRPANPAFRRRIESLEQDSLGKEYRLRLKRGLSKLDQLLGFCGHPKPGGWIVG